MRAGSGNCGMLDGSPGHLGLSDDELTFLIKKVSLKICAMNSNRSDECTRFLD